MLETILEFIGTHLMNIFRAAFTLWAYLLVGSAIYIFAWPLYDWVRRLREEWKENKKSSSSQ